MHHSARVDGHLAVLHVPAADGPHVIHQQLGVHLARVLQEAEVVERPAQALGIVVEDRLERRDLERDLVPVEVLGHPEVEEADAPVWQQEVVPGVSVRVSAGGV